MKRIAFYEKPSLEDLEHYGVKGMKWGVIRETKYRASQKRYLDNDFNDWKKRINKMNIKNKKEALKALEKLHSRESKKIKTMSIKDIKKEKRVRLKASAMIGAPLSLVPIFSIAGGIVSGVPGLAAFGGVQAAVALCAAKYGSRIKRLPSDKVSKEVDDFVKKKNKRIQSDFNLIRMQNETFMQQVNQINNQNFMMNVLNDVSQANLMAQQAMDTANMMSSMSMGGMPF